MSVDTSWDGEVLVASIDRPHRRNAADLAVYDLLEEAVATDAAAVVVTGSGGDFSAGDDVAIFDFDGMAAAEEFLARVTRLFELVESVPRPVVAAVDGYALGFGFELALVCDLAVATPEAVFGLPEITHGAAPPNALGRGIDVLGRGWVRHLAVTGRRWLTGREAHQRGMVVELHPRDQLRSAAVELAGAAARSSEFAHAKRLLTADAGSTYRMVPPVMAPLMASSTVANSRRSYTGHG